MEVNLKGEAAAAEKVVEEIAKVEPMIATGISMFVPGAAPIVATVQPIVAMAIPFLERGLNDIAQNNGGDLMSALVEMLEHLSSSKPNSPILSPMPTQLARDRMVPEAS